MSAWLSVIKPRLCADWCPCQKCKKNYDKKAFGRVVSLQCNVRAFMQRKIIAL